MKVAVIGGGSTYTPELLDGLLRASENGTLPISELVLQDQDQFRLSVIEPLCQRIVARGKAAFAIRATQDVEDAVDGASFILVQIRVGGNRARFLDERISISHGLVAQETTGLGGFSTALRTIPVIRSLAEIITSKAPCAWLLDFTNPVSIVTQVLADNFPGLKWVGLCNYPYNLRKDISRFLGLKDENRLFSDFVGLNHLSFVRSVILDGEDITEKILETQSDLGRLNNLPVNQFQSRLLRSLRILPNPYLAYYWNTRSILQRQRDDPSSRAKVVEALESKLLELYRDPGLDEIPALLASRGGAHYSTVAVNLMGSLHNGTGDIQVLNVPNRGAIDGLDYGDTVEVNCLVNRSGARPLGGASLPDSVRGLVVSVKAYERLVAKAAWSGSYDDAYRALLSHPLCADPEIAEMALDEIIKVHRGMLSGFEKS